MANSYLIHHKHILWVRFYLFLDNVNKVLFQLLQVSDGFFQEEVSMHPDHKQTQMNEISWRLPRSEVTCRGAGGRRGGRHSRGRAPAACCTTPSSPPGHHHHHHHHHYHYLVTLSPAPRGTLSRTCWNPSSVGWAQPNIGNPGTWDGISVNRGQHSSVSEKERINHQ